MVWKPKVVSFCARFFKIDSTQDIVMTLFLPSTSWLNKYTITLLLVSYPKVFVIYESFHDI